MVLTRRNNYENALPLGRIVVTLGALKALAF